MSIKAEMNGTNVILKIHGSNMVLTIKDTQEICKAIHGVLYVPSGK